MKIDRKFVERVATYLIGVAIGLVLLGFVQMKRSQAHRQASPPAASPQPTGESASPVRTDP
ncbi:MAG: hypothetical protein AAFR96_09715 [Planctomycetota bacterium]